MTKSQITSPIAYFYLIASSEFAGASGKMNTTADLFAGGAFVLNAQKNYAQSNQKLDQALGIDASWNFAFGLALNANDLHLLKAQNHFLLGEFSESLSAVLVLNASFTGDVLTNEGRAALASATERCSASFCACRCIC